MIILNMPPLDPKEYDAKNVYEWRQFLKQELLKKRKFRSDLSGKLLTNGCDMHEGIITRAVVRGLRWNIRIFHEYNCFLLLREEHINPPSREWAIEKAFEYYGKDNVVSWFYSLPWKVPPFKIENF